MRYPLVAPNPPRVADHLDAFARIEASGIYSNNGAELRRFEVEATEHLFGGHGASLGVNNATIGLSIAIRHAAGERRGYALVPALTFAATGQAAWWAGLTPLICDVDRENWGLCRSEEARLLAKYGNEIACIVPYATFGDSIDVDHYARLHAHTGVVIDAASSLGFRGSDGLGLAATAPFAVVHSMQATKTFAVGEGGLIHSGDSATIATLRSMAGFGFQGERSATLPGTNAKLDEFTAVLARAKLGEIDRVVLNRTLVEQAYRSALSGFELQRVAAGLRASQFMPVLLPRAIGDARDRIAARLAQAGIGSGAYFSPHLGQQPWFQANATIEPTPVADDIADRIISLPVTDAMTVDDALIVAEAFVNACAAETRRPARAREAVAQTLVIGAGPAGTALLTAASKSGALGELAANGLVLVERDRHIGNGRLGSYAITSDSTAATFLTAVKDNPYPEIARIEQEPAGRGVAAYADALGVPLVDAGPLLRATGERLARIVAREGGEVLARHDAIQSRRTVDGQWRTTLRRLFDGQVFDRVSDNIVVATGGYQPPERLADQQVAGASLTQLAGDRLVQSDDVLSVAGYAEIAERLAGKRDPRVVVIGGSTSALTSIALLLKTRPALPFGAGAITLLHRRPLRPFYHSVEAAHAEGFTDFGPEDICPVSGFVYRLAGFRLEARELVLRMLGIDGRAPDPRINVHQIAGDDIAARAAIAGADLVIAALGYRPHAHPLLDSDGNPIALAADSGAPMVDAQCRILAADGAPVPGAFGIGLAAGFVPWGELGGEASFRGQANGLWMWQNAVGKMIVDQLLSRGERLRVAA